jgi:PadR family transcriptional regulator, regulatory protein PadR
MLAELEQAVLLATLRLDGDGYGLTIRDEITRATGRELAIGTIHKTLTRLEAKELVLSRMGDASPHRGGRAKRHYAVTTSGVRELKASLRGIRRLAAGLRLGLDS